MPHNIMIKSFDDLVASMPIELVGSLDLMKHRKPSHLARIARHELDLFDEGEESDIEDQAGRRTVERFMRTCERSIVKGD